MSKDFDTFKQQVKESNDIVSVISKYVTLNQKGKTYWANCPFHFEKTPSFAVNGYEQYYHCFGCGVSGDVFNFVQHMESCDFFDALKLLAESAGLKMPEFAGVEKDSERKTQREKIYEVLREAALYYFKNLNKADAKLALEYFTKRKIDTQVVKDFGLGYSTGWQDLINHLKTKGYSLEIMQMAGLIDKSKKGNYYDVFTGRLIFPIINSQNNVIGFSARALDSQTMPKYRNTGDTLVFQKNNVVYAINLLKKLKQQEGLTEVLIVEGQMDVISVYKSGVKNVVACMGTALTLNHAKQIKKYCDKVVLCFDGDNAGKKATVKSIDILLNAGLNVNVINLPKGDDPDDYVLKNGVERFKNLIDNAYYWVEYLIREYAENSNLKKLEDRNSFVNSSLDVIKKLSSNSEQNVYLELVEKLSNISIEILKKDLENLNNAAPKTIHATRSVKNENAQNKAVKFIMASLLHKKDYATLNEEIYKFLRNADITKLYNYFLDCKKQNKMPIISNMFDMFDVENNAFVSDIINYSFNELIDNADYFKDCEKVLMVTGLNNEKDKLASQLAEASDVEKKEVSKQIILIIEKLNKLK